MYTNKKRILMADHHRLVAAGIRELLAARYEVVGIVGNGRALLEATAKSPDVVLTDLSLPGLDIFETIRQLRQSVPAVSVIVVTTYDDKEHVTAAFAAGTAGYLTKSSTPKELLEAIETVLAGRRYLSPAIAGRLVSTFLGLQPTEPVSPLTRRETEVASWVARGLENTEIAQQLCIAEVTVRTHFQRILTKLKLRNRVELARYVLSRKGATVDEGLPSGALGARAG